MTLSVLILVMLVSVTAVTTVPTDTASAGTYNDFVYGVHLDVSLKPISILIWSYTGTTNSHVIIPRTITDSTYGELPVTHISGFSDHREITSVSIPDTVTGIGDDTFRGCTGLTSVTIPDSVKDIGNRAFQGCTGLTSAIVGSGVTSMGSYAFDGCTALTGVTVKPGVKVIGQSAFYGCSALTSVVLPDGVTRIGERAFAMSSITSLVIPASVTTLESQALSFCPFLTSIVIPDSVTSFGTGMFAEDTALKSVTLGNGVTGLDQFMFQSCRALTDLVLGDNIPSINLDTFFYTASLTNLTIGKGVNSIDVRALSSYYYSSALAKITVDGGNSNFASVDDVLYDKARTSILHCPLKKGGAVTIPNTVATVPAGAFDGRSGITSVAIGSGVISIGDSAFRGLYKLTSIVIPDSVTGIGDSAFQDCTGLRTVDLGDNVAAIGNNAFRGCSALGSVVIPDKVTNIGDNAFQGCVGLGSVTISNSATSIGNYAFQGCTALGSLDLGNGVISIGQYAFQGCSALGSVVIPDSVTDIGAGAFEGCSALGSIVIPDSVISIGQYAFQGCSALGSVDLGSGFAILADGVFQGCAALLAIEIPDSVTSIGNNAFQGCTALGSVDMGTSIVTIGAGAFSGTALTSVTVPRGVTVIGSGAFGNCPQLSDINIEPGNSVFSSIKGVLLNHDNTAILFFPEGKGGHYDIPNTITGINDGTFQNRQVTSVIIPGSVTSIGQYAFQGCSALGSVVIPDSVTDIGTGAFEGCSALGSIVIPDSVTGIGFAAFSACTALESVVIPDSVTSIGQFAFLGCTGLTSVTVGRGVQSSPYTYTIFQRCTALVAINVHPDNAHLNSTDGVLFNKDRTELIYCPEGKGGDYGMPGTVTTIREYAFYRNQALTSVTINDGVAGIPDYAFRGCIALGSVHMPDSVTGIGRYAFQGCSALTSAIVSENVRAIENYAFDGCLQLSSVTLGKNLTSIGNNAFQKCSALTSIVIPGHVNNIGTNAFRDCTNLTTMIFKGDAPAGLGGNWIAGHNQSLAVYRYAVAGGFSPLWQGLPTYTLGAPKDLAAVSGDGSVTLTWDVPSFTGGRAVDYYDVYVDGTFNQRTYSTAATVTGLINGQAYQFSVAAHHAAGFGQNSTIMAMPGLVITSVDDGSYVTDGTVTVEWTALDDIVKNETSLNGVDWDEVPGASGMFHLLDDQYTVYVRVTNGTGFQTITKVSFIVDTAAPSIDIVSPTPGRYNTGSITVTWSGQDGGSGIAHYNVSVWNGASWDNQTYLAPNVASWVLDLADGSYAVYVEAIDNFGRSNVASVIFVVDKTAPTAIVSPVSNDVPVNSPISVAFSEAMDQGSVVITVNGVAVDPDWDGNVATFAPSPSLMYNTVYTIIVSGTDLAGNPLGTIVWSFATMRDEGTITGTVQDVDGHAIANAIVTLSNGRMTATNATGHFELSGVTSGSYTLTVTKDGYQAREQSVMLGAGEDKGLEPLNLQAEVDDGPSDTPGGDDTADKEDGPDNTLLYVGMVAAIVVVGAIGAFLFLRPKK